MEYSNAAWNKMNRFLYILAWGWQFKQPVSGRTWSQAQLLAVLTPLHPHHQDVQFPLTWAAQQICKTCHGHLCESADPKPGVMSLVILFISPGADLMANHGMLHFINYFSTCQILWKEIKYCKKEIICLENLCQQQKGTEDQWVPFYQQCISITQLVLFPKVALRSKHWRMNLHK